MSLVSLPGVHRRLQPRRRQWQAEQFHAEGVVNGVGDHGSGGVVIAGSPPPLGGSSLFS
ncbi:MAG TPA: hypothetical protein VMX35_12675 [Acidobacteriota bacterium]|nr:hypothetical protein [Acidobacteriota bacterium]